MPQPSSTEALLGEIAACPANMFATIDGGHFVNLAGMIEITNLVATPLYLEGGDAEVLAAGPHLVEVHSAAHVHELVSLAGDLPALVFWSWPGDLASLRHHMRTLNLVEIPNERRLEAIDPAYEAVLFRYWDPNVLAAFLPAFTDGQLARFFGDAAALVFDAPDHGGLLVAAKPPAVSAVRGMLRFDPEQVAALSAQRIGASQRRIGTYLRDMAPEHSRSLDAPALAGLVAVCAQEAATFGLTGERDIAMWSYLQLVSGGALYQEPAVRQMFALADPQVPPSDRLKALWVLIEQQLGRA
jgi:hypothetical protein